MNFKKYDIQDGSGTVINNYGGGSGGNVTIDLTEVYNRIDQVNQAVDKNKDDIRTINNRLSGLDNEYLNHGGDSDPSGYTFGQVISDDVHSPWYFSNGMGFRAVYSESGYTFIVKDVGISNIAFSGKTGENVSLINNQQVKVSVQWDNAFTITNSIQGANVLFNAGISALPAGATLIEEHCYISIIQEMQGGGQGQGAPALEEVEVEEQRHVKYDPIEDESTIYTEEAVELSDTTGIDIGDIETGDTLPGKWSEIYKDGNQWFVPLKYDGRQTTYSIYYEAVVMYQGSVANYVHAYIEGTEGNGTTRFYGGTSKMSEMTPDYVKVINGNDGMRMTPTQVQYTHDAGAHWYDFFALMPVTLYETDGTTGILGVNNNALGENWQLTNYDFSPYKYLRCYIKMADMSDSSNALTPALIINVPLDAAVTAKAANDSTTISPKTPCTMYIAGGASPNPSDQNRVFTALIAVDSTKTKLQMVCENSLYGTAQTNRNTDGRYLYKIEGCFI